MVLLENFWLFDSTGRMHIQIPEKIENKDENSINVNFINKFVQGLYGFMNEIGSKKINSVILEKMAFSFIIIKFEDFMNRVIKKTKSKNFEDVKNIDLIFVGKIPEENIKKSSDIIQVLDKILKHFSKLKIDFSLLKSTEFSKILSESDNETRTLFLSKLKNYIHF